MAVESDGSILVAETDRNRVREIGPTGATSATVNGFAAPDGVSAAGDGTVFVSDKA